MIPGEIRLFYFPGDCLRLTVGSERSYLAVKPVWAAPLSHPGRYLALLNGKGEEIILVEDPEDLPADSLAAARRELKHRYLTATVTEILSARQEYGATYWHVRTDRGDREFVTQNLQENALWLTENHLMLLDVDGNRFEIPDVSQLAERSRSLIALIL